MNLYKNLLVVVCVILGAGVGVGVAEWRFTDPDVILGARLLFGLVGAIIGWAASRWIVARSPVSN